MIKKYGNLVLNGVKLSGYNGRKNCVEVPEGIEVIERNVFFGHKSHKKIILPSSLKEIGDSAFLACENLEEVVIPDGVKVIGGSAFSGCKSLRTLTIPGSVKEILDGTFFGCSSLQRLTFCEGVEKLNMGFLFTCESLVELDLPASLVKIKRFPLFFRSNINLNVTPSFMELIKDEGAGTVQKKALYGFFRRYYAKTISEKDSSDWRTYMSRRTSWLFRLLGEEPLLYKYLTDERILSPKRAEELLDATQNVEVRAILLTYLNDRKKKNQNVESIVDNLLSL